ncbi:aspartate aminotransferase family protein, partial [Escherichia sp. TWPC-MK]
FTEQTIAVINSIKTLNKPVVTLFNAGQAKQISQEAAKAGVMVLIAGGNVVRFAPALNVSEEEVTTGLDRFAAACEHFVSRGSS